MPARHRPSPPVTTGHLPTLINTTTAATTDAATTTGAVHFPCALPNALHVRLRTTACVELDVALLLAGPLPISPLTKQTRMAYARQVGIVELKERVDGQGESIAALRQETDGRASKLNASVDGLSQRCVRARTLACCTATCMRARALAFASELACELAWHASLQARGAGVRLSAARAPGMRRHCPSILLLPPCGPRSLHGMKGCCRLQVIKKKVGGASLRACVVPVRVALVLACCWTPCVLRRRCRWCGC